MAEKDNKGRKPLIERFFSLFAKKPRAPILPETKKEKILGRRIDKEEVRKVLEQYKEEKIVPLKVEETVFEALESREFKEFELEERQLKMIKSFFEKLDSRSFEERTWNSNFVKPFFINDGVGKGLRPMLEREKDMPEKIRKSIADELRQMEEDDYVV